MKEVDRLSEKVNPFLKESTNYFQVLNTSLFKGHMFHTAGRLLFYDQPLTHDKIL